MHFEFSSDHYQRAIGHVGFDEPKWLRNALDLESEMDDTYRVAKIEELFLEHIIPNSKLVNTISGIFKLYETKKLFLLPAVLNEVKRLLSEKDTF